MSKFWAGLGGKPGMLTIAAVGAVVLGTAIWLQFGNEPASQIAEGNATPVALLPQTAPEASAVVVPATPKPESTAVAETPAGTQTTTSEPEVAAAAIPAPAFDEVRREADGMTVIAGRAVPGAQVEVLQNGISVATATADSSGKFATLAIIPPDGAGHVLSLLQQAGEGQQASEDEIILAPTRAPTPEVAAAQPVAKAAASDVTTDAAPTTATPSQVVETTVPETATASASADAASVRPQAPSVPVETPQQTTPPTSVTPTEPQRVAVLKATEEGIELLNTPRPDVMGTVALDTISYSDAGDVQLSGRARANTRVVRVYLDNNAVISLPVDDQGRWRGDLPDVDAGIYTLRVDEVASDGTVSSRVETPFKRESVATLTAASAGQSGQIKVITVQKGATLWAIARDRYGDGLLYVRVFEANADAIRDADLIYPGQVFDLPD
jgi:nucleoid-associated protein YgaU